MHNRVTVDYDNDERVWLARRRGETLGANHRIGVHHRFAAEQWAAWLVGAEIPLTASQQQALEQIDYGPARELTYQSLVGAPGQLTDEFCQVAMSMFEMVICTSLSDEEALVRARTTPSGTSGGWKRSHRTDQPLPCEDGPDTHRHLIFEAS